MAKPNCKCLTCQTEYYFCLKCGQSKNVPAWHRDFCDETCKNVFETICSYNCGSLTKEQASEMIGEVDPAKAATFKDSIKTKLKEIKSGEKKEKNEKGSFIDKKKEQKSEDKSEEKSKEDYSVGLMAPTTDADSEK